MLSRIIHKIGINRPILIHINKVEPVVSCISKKIRTTYITPVQSDCTVI
jgi:hypothetical protein